LALAGFGDFEVARWCHPRLTTVAVDCAAIGRRAAEIVLEALEFRKRGEIPEPQTTIVEFRIIERETT
jgi:LacI family gluconate utilization system Gnt-I transcriptional repressor